MAPLDLDEPMRQLEQDVDREDGRIHVTGTAADEPVIPATETLVPPTTQRCGSTDRELLDQPFCDAPLHRRAR